MSMVPGLGDISGILLSGASGEVFKRIANQGLGVQNNCAGNSRGLAHYLPTSLYIFPPLRSATYNSPSLSKPKELMLRPLSIKSARSHWPWALGVSDQILP